MTNTFIDEERAKKITLKIVPLPPVSEDGLENIMLGVRKKRTTQSIKNKLKKHDQAKMTDEWVKASPFEKMVLILLAEHRTLSAPQLRKFFTIFTNQSTLAIDTWLYNLEKQYNTTLPPKKLFFTRSQQTIQKKIDRLRNKGLVAAVKNSTNNVLVDTSVAPSLFSMHLFLTEYGAQVVANGTSLPLIKKGDKINGIPFVANYENYAFDSLLHITEVNDFFISTIVACQDLMNNYPAQVGVLDINQWSHESKTEHRFELNPGEGVVFKTDGLMVIFSSLRSNFIDFYLEHDTGRATAQKIKQKTLAFLQFILYKKIKARSEGELFRNPLLLFVISSECRIEFYRNEIIKAVTSEMSSHIDYLNAFGRIAVTTNGRIKEKSPIGDIWQIVDIRTGTISKQHFNLITIAW